MGENFCGDEYKIQAKILVTIIVIHLGDIG